MGFVYFAYGSNMWLPRLRSRCPSVRPMGTGAVTGWAPEYDKPSTDGSSKLNLRPADGEIARGALYEIDEVEREALDRAEPLYEPVTLVVAADGAGHIEALSYRWEGPSASEPPYRWYVELVTRGARTHGLPDPYVRDRLERAGTALA